MITINSQPQKFTPVENPILFQITSDSVGITYFIVEVLSEDDSIIAVQKYYTLPNLTSGTYFDLSFILKNYVDHEVAYSTTIIEPLTTLLLKYKVRITEYVFDGSSNVAGSDLTTDLFVVWNAELQRTDFSAFDYHDYVITSYAGSTKFLNNKPVVSSFLRNSNEYLFFINDGVEAMVKFEFFGKNNQYLGTHYITGITTDMSAGRINVNSGTLSTLLGDGFNYVYGDQFEDAFSIIFGEYYEVNSSDHFTVQVVDTNDDPKSEIRTFVLKNDDCKVKHFQLLISNNLGGVDIVDLFNPKESISTSKTTIKKFPYQLNSYGVLSDTAYGIYNETTSIINSNTTSSYKAFSGVLNDAQAIWLKDISKAKKVYVRAANGLLLPVIVSSDSYAVQLRRYNKNNNRIEIDFTTDVSGLFD